MSRRVPFRVERDDEEHERNMDEILTFRNGVRENW
jgi:hypothetical protein